MAACPPIPSSRPRERDDTMKTDFRNRAFLPVLIPVAVLLAMALSIGLFALILLYNTHYGALALAGVAAAGILFTVSLAASQDRLDATRRAAVFGAAAVPFLVGGAYSAGLIGDIPDEARNINEQPLIQVPDDAVIYAEDSMNFCLPANGTCEPIDVWTVAYQGEDGFSFEFVNNEPGVPHNVHIFTLAGTVEEPEMGDESLIAGPLFPGVASQVTQSDVALEVGQYYFHCDAHVNMNGVLDIVEAEGEA